MARVARRRGMTAIEVVVVVAILAAVVLMLMMAIPRGREQARLAACQANLMPIGIALAIYDESQGHLPVVAASDDGAVRGDGPLKALLTVLDVPDLREAAALKEDRRPERRGVGPGERAVPGFSCASDPGVIAGLFAAPISYRAATGDAPDGRNGAFAPGRQIRLSAIEALDGTSFTAAFSERLVGTGRPLPAPSNYAAVPGPLAATGCPTADPSSWRGDAGSSWVAADWRSTLYSHAMTPNATPSCIADDGRAAFMGASSGHVDGVNLLALDGSVRTITLRVDAKVWREWGAIGETPEPGTPSPLSGASEPAGATSPAIPSR
jgi:prepilin-type N-terminal cleavage/methylation domain-containing protein